MGCGLRAPTIPGFKCSPLAAMGFRYLDKIATPEHVQQFLELADLAMGAGASAENVFLLSHRLRDSRPMQHCRKRLARNPACQALIDARRLCGPYNS
jgi:ubiquinone biosynthesis protein COQ4